MTSANMEKPKDARELQEFILRYRREFTPKMLEAAAFVTENPQAVALETISSLASHSGLAPSSFVRLAKIMGFSGFSEMQNIYRAPLRDAYPTSLSERIRHSQGDEEVPDPGNLSELGRSFCKANAGSLAHLSERLDDMDLDACVDMICATRVIYVLGVDRSFAPAAYLSYALNRIRLQTVQIVGLGSAIEDHAAVMAPGDILIPISFPPYAQDTITVTRVARERGNGILAITGSTVSPIAEGAQQVLLVDDAELHGFRSLSALMSLLQTLTIGIAYRQQNSRQGYDLDNINA